MTSHSSSWQLPELKNSLLKWLKHIWNKRRAPEWISSSFDEVCDSPTDLGRKFQDIGQILYHILYLICIKLRFEREYTYFLQKGIISSASWKINGSNFKSKSLSNNKISHQDYKKGINSCLEDIPRAYKQAIASILHSWSSTHSPGRTEHILRNLSLVYLVFRFSLLVLNYPIYSSCSLDRCNLSLNIVETSQRSYRRRNSH